jgi:hypothetical protein
MTYLEAWLLSGWQALLCYSKQHESAGSLAVMESEAAGTEDSQASTRMDIRGWAEWFTFGLEGCRAGNMLHKQGTM